MVFELSVFVFMPVSLDLAPFFDDLEFLTDFELTAIVIAYYTCSVASHACLSTVSGAICFTLLSLMEHRQVGNAISTVNYMFTLLGGDYCRTLERLIQISLT